MPGKAQIGRANLYTGAQGYAPYKGKFSKKYRASLQPLGPPGHAAAIQGHNTAMPFLQPLWQWTRAQRRPLMWSLGGLLLSFVSLGLPGFASYAPAEQLFVWAGDDALLKAIHGDSLWPILISASFLQALLITPLHCLLRRWRPALPRWPHVLGVVLGVWLISIVCTCLMLLAAVDA
jgi:hypothetical protein